MIGFLYFIVGIVCYYIAQQLQRDFCKTSHTQLKSEYDVFEAALRLTFDGVGFGSFIVIGSLLLYNGIKCF